MRWNFKNVNWCYHGSKNWLGSYKDTGQLLTGLALEKYKKSFNHNVEGNLDICGYMYKLSKKLNKCRYFWNHELDHYLINSKIWKYKLRCLFGLFFENSIFLYRLLWFDMLNDYLQLD